MAHDVFISHARQDKSVADGVCAALEQKGIRCWIAPRDVEPGADWGNAIMQGIKGSRVMVLVLSGSANASPHILREVERAVHLGIVIVPLRIEEVFPEGALEYHLGTVHWLDAMTPLREADLDRLADIVQAILRRDRPVAAERAEAAWEARGYASAGAHQSGGAGAAAPGEQSADHATRSAAPGAERPPGADTPAPPVKRTPVLLVLLFNIITGGIYAAAWFMTRARAINGMRSASRIGTAGFVVAIVLFSLNLIFSFTSGVFEALEEPDGATVFEALGWLTAVPAWIILIVNAFTVRSILDDHFNKHLGMQVPFSGLATFFFVNVYLQYKVNRLVPPPAPAWGTAAPPQPAAAHGPGRGY